MVDALVTVALEKITAVLAEQIELFAGATEELEKLRDTLQSIEAVLADARSRRISGQSFQLWLSRLKDAASEIGKLLDEGRTSGHGKDRNKVFRYLYFIYDYADGIVSRYKMACRIKEIRERLEQIAKDKDRYLFSVGGYSSGGEKTPASSRPQTSSLLDESEIIRMDEDKQAVISELLGGSSSCKDDHVRVIAIVGGGESGKTNLAKQIYHDDKVRDCFNPALYWVCVTDVFDAVRLTKAILEQVNGTSASLSELNSLQYKLHESLKGKRFLLVLDDVWNEENEKWEQLRVSLKSGGQGSKILVTTRSEKVAETMNADFVHKLKVLS